MSADVMVPLTVSSKLPRRSSHGTNSYSPLVELPSSSSKSFFDEAKIRESDIEELRKRFQQFSRDVNVSRHLGEIQRTNLLFLDDFIYMLDTYNAVNDPTKYERFFHAFDRNKDGVLDFDEFLLGVCGADPSTVHILNSFTGYERGRYIFDFYDTNRSNTLEFTEFARLVADCASMKNNDPTNEKVRSAAINKAKELGMLGDAGSLLHFTCVKFKRFYECMQSEKLRGTSRLFRFNNSLVRPKNGEHLSKADVTMETPMAVRSRPTSPQTGPAVVENDISPLQEGTFPPRRSLSNLCEIEHDDSAVNFLHDASVRVVCNSIIRSSLNQRLLGAGVDIRSFVTSAPGGEGFGEEEKSAGSLPPPDRAPSIMKSTETQRSESALSSLMWPTFDAASVSDDQLKQGRAIAKKFLQRCLYDVSPEWYVTYVDEAQRDGRRGAGALSQLSSTDELVLILRTASRVLLSDGTFRSSLIDNISAPVKIYGGINGQLLDLLSLFRSFLPPDSFTGDIQYTNYVFLGDYIGPGWCNLDTLALVLCLKILYPGSITLLRGKHEADMSNRHFLAECEERLGIEGGQRIWKLANQCFECLPLAAVVEGRVLCVHGSVPSSLTLLEPLKKLKRPLRASQACGQSTARMSAKLVSEILDPSASSANEDTPPANAKSLMKNGRLAIVVRARGEIPPSGVGSSWGGRLLTVASCLNYCDRIVNDAAIVHLIIDESGLLRIQPRIVTACRPRLLKLILGQGKVDAETALPRWPQAAREGVGSPRALRAARKSIDDRIRESIRTPPWTGASINLGSFEITPDIGGMARSIAMRPEYLQRQQATYLQRRASLPSKAPTTATPSDNVNTVSENTHNASDSHADNSAH